MFSVLNPMLFVRVFIFILASSFLSAIAFASPWISVGETRLKQQLQLLNDTGVTRLSLSTWPVMWADVADALNEVDEKSLNAAQLNAFRELRFELMHQTKSEMKRSLTLGVSNSRTLFRDFDSDLYEKAQISHHFDWDGPNFSFKLQANLETDPGEDVVESQLYGSYIAGVAGSWVLGVGAIDQWWGPGQQSSLILSNNARPVPSVFIRTKHAQTFETPFLSWLGSWHFVTFVGQLESRRFISEAKLTGMRFTFKPFDALEIGLSRGMQWGGEGRSESLSTFFKSVTSQGENTSEQSGNQLAGYDLRYTFLRRPAGGVSLYSQLIGEDEAGYLPSKFLLQAGLESNIALASGDQLGVFLEHANTTAGSIGGKQFDTAYEHSVYKTGYRHRGRVLGASYDNDAQIYSLGVRHSQLTDAQTMSATISLIELNQFGGAGANTVSSTPVELYQLQLGYQRLALGGQLKVKLNWLSDMPPQLEEEFDTFAASVAWLYRF